MDAYGMRCGITEASNDLCCTPLRVTHKPCKKSVVSITLPDYIAQMGDEKAARLFGVETRTAVSWRLRERMPRPRQAKVIVERSPVTMDGIYSEDIPAVKLTESAT